MVAAVTTGTAAVGNMYQRLRDFLMGAKRTMQYVRTRRRVLHVDI